MIGEVIIATSQDYNQCIEAGLKAFSSWKMTPAPQRGEIVRQFGEALRQKKEALGALVSYEMGKSYQEGLGEVQEMIDICDFAVGLSRQLHGLTMHSERPMHRMYEQYHPIGVVGIISAFNFPVAVWAWNTALAWVCGNVCIWKPSEKAPLCGLLVKIMAKVLKENDLDGGICTIVIGDAEIGKLIAAIKTFSICNRFNKNGEICWKSSRGKIGQILLELGGIMQLF